MSADARPFEPFFVRARGGERFCIHHPAWPAPRGAIVYLHPFAEEMNKSRRMAALQSRALAARGYAVLQIDLAGCGESGGEFSDATWDAWHDDVALACQWMRARVDGPLWLWGLRAGALLALDHGQADGYLLWQPVLDGAQMLAQFLRLRVAADAIAGEGRETVEALRTRLRAGHALEIGGYALAPALATAIERKRLVDLAPRDRPVHWLEVSAGGDALGPAAAPVAEAWRARGTDLRVQVVPGDPFWATVEIAECPALVDATLSAADVLYSAAQRTTTAHEQ